MNQDGIPLQNVHPQNGDETNPNSEVTPQHITHYPTTSSVPLLPSVDGADDTASTTSASHNHLDHGVASPSDENPTSTSAVPLLATSNGPHATASTTSATPAATSGTNAMPSTPWYRQSFLLAWWLELLALFLGLLMIIAIQAVLAHFDNAPLRSLPYDVSLNTIVSLLTQVFTVSVGYAVSEAIGQARWNWFGFWPSQRLGHDHSSKGHNSDSDSPTRRSPARPLTDFVVLDEAMRGPMGAAKLFWKRPIMLARSAAALGASVTIALPVVGIFTQELVRYQSQPVVFDNTSANTTSGSSRSNSSSAATVPITRYYNGYGEGSIHSVKTPTLTVKGGFYQAIYSLQSDEDTLTVTASCATGNCTWPEYATLAVCGTCVDRSAEIETSCQAGDIVDRCSVRIGNGSSGPTGVTGTDFPTILNSTQDAMSAGMAAQLDTLSSHGNELSRTTFLFPRNPQKGYNNNDSYAYTCSLYMCVQTMRSAMTNGVRTETLVATFPNQTTDAADAAAKISNTGGASDALGTVTLAPTADDDGAVFAEGATTVNYTVDMLSWNGFLNFFPQAMNGSGRGEIGEQSFTSDALAVLYTNFLAYLPTTTALNDTALTLSQADGGVVGYFYQILAASLTKAIRTDATDRNPITADGTAFQTKTYVTIAWAWLALPAVVLVFAAALLAAVIWETEHRRMDTFKSGSLPTLFTRVPVEDMANAAHLPLPQTADEMLAVAKTTDVRLHRTSNGSLALA